VAHDRFDQWSRAVGRLTARRTLLKGSLAATLAAELPAILAWAVEGCQAWQRD